MDPNWGKAEQTPIPVRTRGARVGPSGHLDSGQDSDRTDDHAAFTPNPNAIGQA